MVRIILLVVALFSCFPKTTAIVVGFSALACGIVTHSFVFGIIAIVCLVPMFTRDLD